MKTIDNIPDEVLEKIFNQINKTDITSKININKVSKRFQSVNKSRNKILNLDRDNVMQLNEIRDARYFTSFPYLQRLIISEDLQPIGPKISSKYYVNWQIVLAALKYCPNLKVIRTIRLARKRDDYRGIQRPDSRAYFDPYTRYTIIDQITENIIAAIAKHGNIIDVAFMYTDFYFTNEEKLSSVMNKLEIFYMNGDISYVLGGQLGNFFKVINSFTKNNKLKVFIWTIPVNFYGPMSDENAELIKLDSFLDKVKDNLEIFDVNIDDGRIKMILSNVIMKCSKLKIVKVYYTYTFNISPNNRVFNIVDNLKLKFPHITFYLTNYRPYNMFANYAIGINRDDFICENDTFPDYWLHNYAI